MVYVPIGYAKGKENIERTVEVERLDPVLIILKRDQKLIEKGGFPKSVRLGCFDSRMRQLERIKLMQSPRPLILNPRGRSKPTSDDPATTSLNYLGDLIVGLEEIKSNLDSWGEDYELHIPKLPEYLNLSR